MATLGKKQASDPVKVLIVGDSGSGKTGALASLVSAGYELFILDFDNGTDILNFTVPHDLKGKVHIETLTDTGKFSGPVGNQKIMKLSPQAFPKALNLLSRWKDSDTGEDFGPVTSWGPGRIVVIDSLSFMGNATLDYVLARNGRTGEQPHPSDWGDAMRMLEQTLQMLYSDDVRCHVVVISHIVYSTADASGIQKGLPMALGEKLPPKVGRYFNMMLLCRTKGTGDNVRRLLLTKPEASVEAKCPIITAAKEYPAESGLATLFALWQGNKPT